MSSFKVTASELQSAAKKIEENIQAYENASKSAKAAADDLSGKWEGDARNAFAEEQEKAFAWYTRMAALVRTYVSAMEKAAKAYEAVDATAKGIIKSM